MSESPQTLCYSEEFETEIESRSNVISSYGTAQGGARSSTMSLELSSYSEYSTDDGSEISESSSFIETDISSYSTTSATTTTEESLSPEELWNTSFKAEDARSNFVAGKLKILQADSQNMVKSSDGKQKMTQENQSESFITDFCKDKVQQLRSNRDKLILKDVKPVDNTNITRTCETSGDAVFRERVIDNLKIENLLHELKEANKKQIHEPRKCLKCRRKKAELKKKDFLRRKLLIAEEPEFNKRLEGHLYFKDSATLIAQIVNEGPHPAEEPGALWSKLLKQETNPALK